MITDAERREKNRLKQQKWRANNLEHTRQYQRLYKRRWRAAKKVEDADGLNK